LAGERDIFQDPTFVRMDISGLEVVGYSVDDPPTPPGGCRECGERVCGERNEKLTMTILQAALVVYFLFELSVVMSKPLIDQSSMLLQVRTRGAETIRCLSSRASL
jgi:hypothetical protein